MFIQCSFAAVLVASSGTDQLKFRIQATGPATVESTEIGPHDATNGSYEIYSFHKLITVSQAGDYTFNLQVDLSTTSDDLVAEDLEITAFKLN